MNLIHDFRKRSDLFLLLFFLLITAFFIAGIHSESTAAAQLSNDDCVKCHKAVQETVDAKGNKHKTAVSCSDCHRGHPPMVSKDKIIPVCSECHSGKKHYQIGNCKTCHSNPHAPVDMKLAANLTAPCLTCHEKQGDEMKTHQTKHSKFFCTTCHKAHRQIPPCMQCHRPHTSDMTEKDCQGCHPAHQPLTITYGADMPSKTCAACHKNIYDTLTGIDTKHAKLACVYCHKDKHRNVPACENCHGSPHPAGMVAKFPKCNMCHTSAHSLGKEALK